MNQIANEWQDYEVIDTGNREKLERWNHVILRRPDPVAVWPIEDEKSGTERMRCITVPIRAEAAGNTKNR